MLPVLALALKELFKAIHILEDLERLSQEEELPTAVGEGAEASQGRPSNLHKEQVQGSHWHQRRRPMPLALPKEKSAQRFVSTR
jgi:hypothetical protein